MPKKSRFRGSKTGRAALKRNRDRVARSRERRLQTDDEIFQDDDDTSQTETDISQEETDISQEETEISEEETEISEGEGETSQGEVAVDNFFDLPEFTTGLGKMNIRRKTSLTGRRERIRNRSNMKAIRSATNQNKPSKEEMDDDVLLEYTSREGRNIKKKATEFENELKSITIDQCANCRRKFPELNLKAGLCRVCKKDPNKLVAPNLIITPVPPELQNLTLIEQMLIAQVHPVVQFHRIRNAQTGYKGNVISFVQDIGECYKVLPLLPEEVAKVIMFTKNTPKGKVQFKADRKKILTALQWLKENNEFYRHITISETNAARIPPDGDMVPVLEEYAIDMPEDATEPTTSRGPPVEKENSEEIENDENINETFVPLLVPVDQQQQVQEQLKLPYPEMSRAPVDEFAEEGYIAKAFPCLFPTGQGDFLYSKRNIKITQKEYMEYLLQYEDRRFIKDKRFCYFAMNTLLRHQALTTTGLAVKKSSLDGKTVKKLREEMEKNPNFIRKVLAFAAKLRSTQQYWGQRCGELLDMVKQLGCPTIFFTLSAADYHWPDLFRLLLENEGQPDRKPEELTKKKRRDLMHNNPDIVAYFLQKRCQLFVNKFLKPVFGVVDSWCRLVCVPVLVK